MHSAVGSSNKANMSVSRNASILLERLLLLSRHFRPMILIVFASITALTLSFQISRTNNGVRHHGVRQSNFGVNYRIRQTGWASFPSSPSISPSYKLPPETLLRLSADPIPSYSHFTQQQRSPGIGTEVNSRDMISLSEWYRSCEIVLADGVELTEDLLGDWSLTTMKSIEQGSSILTVPSQVILTSDINGDSYLPYYSETDMQNVRVWMESQLESGPQSKQDYLPEYMLVFKLIREVYLETSSPWHPWLQSLPTQFSTGLYLDEVERNHVERMTGEHIQVQGLQYQACLELFQTLVSSQESGGTKALIPTKFIEWMLALQQDCNKEDACFDNLVKWAFSIVFTRSWRSPDRSQAQIVPLGDLANHDSQFANLMPGFRQTDGAFQFFVTSDIDAVAGPSSPKLYLSYGLTYHPARYLVVFGFCDVTAAYIDAQLDFLQDNEDCKWPTTLDPSQLVVSTLNGALSEEVWSAFLYKILMEDDPELLAQIRDAYDDNEERGDQLVEEVLETKEFTVGMEIQAHYQRLLETDFIPILVTEKDLSEHPNLSMIVNYNLFIRETYLNVLEHVIIFLTQCTEFQELSTSKSKNELDSVALKPKENSTLYSELKSEERSNQTSVSSRSDSVSLKSESESFQSVPAQFSSSEPSYKDSADMERDNNLPSNISMQTVQDSFWSNSTSSFSTENLDQQSYSVQESQEMIELNTTAELNGTMETSRLSYSKDNNVTQEGSNLNSSSRFSFENFSLQSYSKKNATPISYVNSYSRSYSLGQTVPKGIDQQPSPNLPAGNFNPQFYSASQKRRTKESTDMTATSTIPYGKIESQTYPNAKPKFPNGYSDLQSDSLDQPSQEQIDYGNSNSESYSNSQTMPTQERIDSTATPKFPNGNSDPLSYSLDQLIQEQIDYGNSISQSNSTNSKTTPTQERIDPTATSRFPNENSDLQSYSLDQTEASRDIDQTGPSLVDDIDQTGLSIDDDIDQTGPSQDGVDFVTSYAQSLVSDQRGQQQSDIGGTQFSKQQNNRDIPSTPSTYAEYVKQREEESALTTSDQQPDDEYFQYGAGDAFDESENDFTM